MDNKKIEMNRLEYEKMKIVSPVNSIASGRNEIDTNKSQEFRDMIRKSKSTVKKKGIVKNKISSNEDIVVEDSLKTLIDEDQIVKDTIEEKLTSSTVIKNLLSKEENDASSYNVITKEKTGV